MKYFLKHSFFLSLLTAAIIFSGCNKDNTTNNNTNPAPKIPTVSTTDAAGGITSTSANSGGTIVDNGGAVLTGSGVVYSTNIQPTVADGVVNVGTNVGSFVANITGLMPNTTYYVKAYATNSQGTAYGPRITFTTLP